MNQHETSLPQHVLAFTHIFISLRPDRLHSARLRRDEPVHLAAVCSPFGLVGPQCCARFLLFSFRTQSVVGRSLSPSLFVDVKSPEQTLSLSLRCGSRRNKWCNIQQGSDKTTLPISPSGFWALFRHGNQLYFHQLTWEWGHISMVCQWIYWFTHSLRAWTELGIVLNIVVHLLQWVWKMFPSGSGRSCMRRSHQESHCYSLISCMDQRWEMDEE